MPDTTLSVRLFLGSIAVAAFALAVNQAGWRHRVLIVSLFGVSGLSAMSAVFYPRINVSWPNFSSSLGTIASNAWVWFGLVIFLALYVLIWPARINPHQATIEAPARATKDLPAMPPVPRGETVPIQRQETREREIVDVTPEYLMGLYEGRLHAEGQRLAEPYIGKWVIWSGSLAEVRSTGAGRILAMFQLPPLKLRLIYLWFDQKWMERLSVKKLGDQVTISGEIGSLDSAHIELNNCELAS